MKKHYLLWAMLLLVAAAATAQTTEEEISQSIYFASGSTSLDAAGRQALEKAINFAMLPENESYSIILRAYTDDVGSAQKNQLLAQKRAETVCNELIVNGLKSENIQRFALGAVELPSSPTDADRAAARRVDIFVLRRFKSTGITEVIDNKAILNDFLNDLNQEQTQQYRFSCRQPYSFIGEKGTVVQIPENAFVYADDATPVQGEVVLDLREAYSYGDMLLQQLGTTSDGALLETGGMIRMTATDAQGRELAIANGKSILVSMPTAEANTKDMQVFMGEEHGADGLNWDPTNNLVSNSANGFAERSLGLMKNPFAQDPIPAYFHPDSLAHYRALVEKLPGVLERLPREVQQPKFWSKKPQRPNLQAPVAPNKSELAARYPQPQRETAAEYQRSLHYIYKDELEKYYNKKAVYDKKIIAYRRDSAAYARAEQRHQKDMERYHAYQQAMQGITARVQASLVGFDYKKQLAANAKLLQILSAFDLVCQQLEKRKSYLQSAFQGNDSLVTYLQQTAAVNIPKQTQTEEKKWLSKTRYLESALFRVVNDKQMTQHDINSDWKGFKRRLDQINTNEPMKRYHIQVVRQQFAHIRSRYQLSRIPRMSGQMVKTLDDMNLLLQSCWTAQTELDTLRNRQLRCGSGSPEEVAQQYGNALEITQMGWINCDRFYQDGTLKTDVEILADNDANTLLFAVFEDIRSVMPLSFQPNNKRFVGANLPENKSVKIVGIRVVSGSQAEVFVHRGKVKDMKGIKADFKSRSVEELKSELAAL